LAFTFWCVVGFCLLACEPATGQERLCDPSFENCYDPILQLVRDETVGIDIEFYYIELPTLADAIIARHQAGVPVRITVEPRASLKFPQNQPLLDRFRGGGHPDAFQTW
jgi:hypothetical protein